MSTYDRIRSSDSVPQWEGRDFQKGPADRVPVTERNIFVEMAPFRVQPRFVGRVWGWKDLRPWYDHEAEGEPIGEVWLTGDDCEVATGPHAGKTLSEIFEEMAQAMLGENAPSGGSPLLIKVIFAREKLSVQVHPDDRLAQKYGEPRGKSECWYALAAEAGAQVAAGLKAGVTLDTLKAGIESGTLEQSLRMLPVHAGDMIYVDAGTVHAIWPGSVLLETQQNSDLTYRMYDYGRGRELHVEKSLEAVRLRTKAGRVMPQILQDRTVLVEGEYFCVERIAVEVSRSSTSLRREGEAKAGLAYLFTGEGSGRLTSSGFGTVDLHAREIVAVPASSPVFAIQDTGGLDLIRITPRWPQKTA